MTPHKEVAKNRTSDKIVIPGFLVPLNPFPLGASSAAVCVGSGARSLATFQSAEGCWLKAKGRV